MSQSLPLRRSAPFAARALAVALLAFLVAAAPTGARRAAGTRRATTARSRRRHRGARSQPIADRARRRHGDRRDEIARAGAQSLAELLQRQPGVEIVA